MFVILALIAICVLAMMVNKAQTGSYYPENYDGM